MQTKVLDNRGEECRVDFDPLCDGALFSRDRKGGTTIRAVVVLPDGDGYFAWLPVLTAPFQP